MTTAKELHDFADAMAMIVSNKRHHMEVAINWELGTAILNMVEQHAEAIALACRVHAAELSEMERGVIKPPPRSKE